MPVDDQSFVGMGGKVEIRLGSTSGAFTEVADIQAYKPGQRKTDFVEKTIINGSTKTKKKKPTLTDMGADTLDLYSNLTDAGQLLLASAQLANSLLNVKVTFPVTDGYTTGLVREFDAYVSSNGAADLQATAYSQYSVELMWEGSEPTDTAPTPEA